MNEAAIVMSGYLPMLFWLGLMVIVASNAFPKHVVVPKSSHHIIDACNRSVDMTANVKNAVLFTPTIAEYLFVTRKPEALISGYQSNWKLVNESIFKHVYPDLLSPRIDNAINPGVVSTETLFILKPDTIFDWDFRAPYFGSLGLPAVCVSSKRAEEDGLVTNTKLYADVMNESGRAIELTSRYHNDLEKLNNDLPASGEARILFVSINQNGRINALASPLRSMIITKLGGTDLREQLQSSIINAETLLLLDPDILFLEPTAFTYEGPSPSMFMHNAMWQPLKAVRNKRVYNRPPSASLFFVGIVETPLFARWLAELLHPALPTKMRAIMREAYRRELRYTVSDTQLDQLLAVDRNHLSKNYGRFEEIPPIPLN